MTFERDSLGRILPRSLEQQFWPRVTKTDGCWVWTGSRLNNVKYHRTYGVISRMRQGKTSRLLAHRASWQIHHGPIPDGLWVLHRCDNVVCVNPEHLFLGTRSDNHLDMQRKGRASGGSRPGEANHSAHLTDGAVLDIVSELDRGTTQRAIAAKFGVGQMAISRINTGQSWSHITNRRFK